jgi:hypothetical protein
MYLVFNPESITLDVHEGYPSYEEASAIVGGLIEPVDLWEDDRGVVSLWVNEEGLVFNFPSTVAVLNAMQYPEGWLGFGTWYITRTDMSTGEVVEMTQEDVDRIRFDETMSGIRMTTSGEVVPSLEIV